MKPWRIEYTRSFKPGPLSFWVHRHLDSDVWSSATEFAPPLPLPVAGKGYPVLYVTFSDIDLQFSSIHEAKHFMDVMGRKLLPTSMQLSRERNAGHGPNAHWLSRLPAGLKSWKKRQRIVARMSEGVRALEAVYR